MCSVENRRSNAQWKVLLKQVEEWLITLIDRRIDGRIEETVTDLIDEKLEESSFQDDFDISEYTSEIENIAEGGSSEYSK